MKLAYSVFVAAFLIADFFTTDLLIVFLVAVNSNALFTAQRLCCASAILRRPSALILRLPFVRWGSVDLVAYDSSSPLASCTSRNAASAFSMDDFCFSSRAITSLNGFVMCYIDLIVITSRVGRISPLFHSPGASRGIVIGFLAS